MAKNKPVVPANKPANNKPSTAAPVAAKPAPAKNNLLPLVLCLLIPVCTLFIYGKTLNYPLDKLDERPIFSNIQVYSASHPSIWESVYTDAFFGNKSDVLFYRPVQNLSYMIDIAIWGAVPFGVHLTNLLLFICIAFAFLYLLTLFGVPTTLACLIALIFSCHPLYTIAVVWVPSRGDLLSTLFSVLSMASFIRYTNERKGRFIAGTVLFFFLALFSKESVIGLPALFVVYLFINDKQFYHSRQNIVILAALGGVAVAYLIARQMISVTLTGAEHLFTVVNFVGNLRTVPEAMAKAIIPVALSPMPAYSALPTVLGLALLAVVIFVIYKFYKTTPFVALGLFWFLLFIVPAMFFQHRFSVHSYKYLEHRILLPSLGLLLIVALVAKYYFGKAEKPILIAGGVIAIIFVGYSSAYATIFEDQFAFYNRVLAVDPDNILAHTNLANSYFNNKQYDSAINHTSAAIQVYPHFTLALENRSKIYTQLGMPAKALPDLDTLVTIDSTNAEYYTMKGNTENTLGRYGEAMADYSRSLKLLPENGDVLTNMGTILDKMNLKDSAMVNYKKAMLINPNSMYPYVNAGLLETNRQHFADAIGYYNKALKLKPDYWDIYLNRGITYYYAKDYVNALADYNIYLSKVPNNAVALNNLAILKVNMGQQQEACAYLKKAAQLGSQDAIRNLGIYCK